jgi:hypothetical protein
VLFHSLSTLSCACCCVSTSHLGSCQDKPAREPFDSCQLPRALGWGAVCQVRNKELTSPESGLKARQLQWKGCALPNLPSSTLARVLDPGNVAEGKPSGIWRLADLS